MQKTKEQAKKNKKGLTIVFATWMIVFLVVLGVAFLQLGFNARVQSIRNSAVIAARSAADAGLSQARYLMDKKLKEMKDNEMPWDNSWIPYESDITYFDNARFNFNITGDDANGFTISSTGKSGIAERTVYCKIWVRSVWFGIGVRETLVAKVNARFNTIPPGGDFAIRTNSIEPDSIYLNNGVIVPGDVIIGPDGDPNIVVELKMDASVEGEIYSAPEIYFPPVTPPDDLNFQGDIVFFKETREAGNETRRYPSGIYTELRMTNDAELRIKDPNTVFYFTGDFDMGQGTKLIVEDGASLTIYLGADMIAKNDSIITNLNAVDPNTATDEELIEATMSFKIYGLDTCSKIDIFTKSDLFGAVYAPEAHLDLGNTGNLYGAFVGRSMNMNNGGGVLYYVNALSHINLNDETASDFQLIRWWE